MPEVYNNSNNTIIAAVTTNKGLIGRNKPCIIEPSNMVTFHRAVPETLNISINGKLKLSHRIGPYEVVYVYDNEVDINGKIFLFEI
jgi:hypothetical protein